MKPYYEDDLVTLYHGDCLEVSAWQKADVLVTDPPYGISWQQSFGANQNKRWRPVDVVKDVIKNDDSPEARDEVLAQWGAGRPAIVFGSWRIPRPVGTRHTLIWHKAGAFAGVRSGHPFISNHEEVYVLGDGFVSTGTPLYSVMTTTEARHVAVQQIGHPTPKPVGLMEQLIARCPEGVVADPFAGSGATLIAARNLGRRAIGVEVEEKYCELIAKRVGQQAFDFEGII